jgi:PAS domain S-box-containing protein
MPIELVGPYHLTLYSVPPLFTSAGAIALGIAVVLRERASLMSRIFFLMMATTGLWLFAFAWMYSATDEVTASKWATLGYLNVPFICAAIYYFTVQVLGIYQRHRRLVLVSWLLSTIFAATTLWSDAFVDGVYQYWWGYYPRYSWLALPFLCYFAAMMVVSLRHYVVEYRRCPPGIRKMRIKYFVIGFSGVWLAMVDFLPKTGINVYPFGYVPILWWLSFVGFAIWRYHILHLTPSIAAEQILQTMADAVLVIDRDGVIWVANYAAGPLLGMEASEILGTRLVSIDRTLAQAIGLTRWTPQESIHRADITLSPGGNKATTLELPASLMKDTTGETVATVCVLRDVTPRKQAEQALQDLNASLEHQVQERTIDLRSLVLELGRTEERERSRLATDLHDNLAQLLALAKMRLERLGIKVRPAQREAVAGIVELLDEALSYTRTVMADLRPMYSGSEEDLAAAVSWVADKIRKHGLIIEIHGEARNTILDEDILMVTYQCVQELLANVVKHADTDRADIYLGRTNGCLEVSVVDRGKGFDASVTHSPSHKGGFGLFNIRERLHLLGGRLELTSVPGHGTTARILIPLKFNASIANDALSKTAGSRFHELQAQGVTEKRQSHVRVLITDDHPMMRDGLRFAIEKSGDAEVIAEAADGESAVQLARDMKPDVVIMDVNLPKMNGIEATRRIKGELSNIFVIGLSVSGARSVEAAMREAGADAYFSKVDAIDRLCETVRHIARAR